MGHYLPVEVLENIVKFLSLEDSKSFGLVAKQWYQAFLNSHGRDLNLIVRFTSDKYFKLFQQMEIEYMVYRQFEFYHVDITRDSMPFWQKYGENITYLSFNVSRIREHIFAEALSYCTNLQSLTILGCTDLFILGNFADTLKNHSRLQKCLRNVRKFDLSYNRYLSDASLHTILTMCPLVETLVLTGCPISYHQGTYNNFYGKGMPPSENVTTFPTILNAIQNHQISNLNFSETWMDNNSLEKIALSPSFKLRKIEIRKCLQVSDQGIIQMCATGNVSALTELDISGCDRITNETLETVANNLQFLTKLSVQGCKQITDTGMASISRLEKLVYFNGGECEGVIGPGLVQGLAKQMNHTVTSLTLNQMGNVCERDLIQVLKHTVQLRHLDLSCSGNAVTDATVRALFQYCQKLLTLNLENCDSITDCGLTGMQLDKAVESPVEAEPVRIPLGSRHELKIRLDAGIKEQVKELCERSAAEYSLARLQGLRELSLKGCTRVTDVSLQHVFSFKELRGLDMSNCQQISHLGLKEMVKTCRAIEILKLNSCHNLNNEAVEIVVRGLPRLKGLCLGSNIISNDIVAYFDESRIAVLDVRQCSKITPSGISQLREILPTLKTLKYQEVFLVDTEVKPPKPPPHIKLWQWCSRRRNLV